MSGKTIERADEQGQRAADDDASDACQGQGAEAPQIVEMAGVAFLGHPVV